MIERSSSTIYFETMKTTGTAGGFHSECYLNSIAVNFIAGILFFGLLYHNLPTNTTP